VVVEELRFPVPPSLPSWALSRQCDWNPIACPGCGLVFLYALSPTLDHRHRYHDASSQCEIPHRRLEPHLPAVLTTAIAIQ
jgi:hypothetical protein